MIGQVMIITVEGKEDAIVTGMMTTTGIRPE